MKTAELTEAALDWAVAKAIGEYKPVPVPKYSTDWAQGGPIIEREKINLRHDPDCNKAQAWEASDDIDFFEAVYGPTPLVAAMRCYVASKLGDEIDLPKELT